MTEFATARAGAADATAAEIRALLADAHRARVPGDPVTAAYDQRRNRPAWQDPTHVAALVTRLEAAAADGLRPEDYDAAGLRRALAAPPASPREAAARDVHASEALAGYLRDRRGGRLDPATLQPAGWRALGPAVFAAALDAADLDAVAEPPRAPGDSYPILRVALARYRRIAAQGGWGTLPAGRTLDPGERGPRVQQLRERLVRGGELAAGSAAQLDPDLFDATLVTGLALFQERHGLAADGRLGRATVRALNVPAAARVDQLRVALERLRWLPADPGTTYVRVNVPAFRARVWAGGTWAWEGRVIVGRGSRPTPALEARITGIFLNPSWTVPPTILREDVLPELRRDPSYLEREGFEVVARNRNVVPASAVNWARPLAAQGYSLVQPPGPANPLGRLKFLSPNSRDVYLHDTPARRLFDRTERAFSSGCIRVEDPLRVAEILLDDPALRAADLEARIAQGGSSTVRLRRAVLLLVVYWTAEAAPDGSVRFYRDLYGEDARVLAALEGRPIPDPARGPEVRPPPRPAAP